MRLQVNEAVNTVIQDKAGQIVATCWRSSKKKKTIAKEFVRRWNAFEDGGLVDELKVALEGDFENCVPNVPMILSQALLGNYEAVKTMLRELSSINAKAIALAKS